MRVKGRLLCCLLCSRGTHVSCDTPGRETVMRRGRLGGDNDVGSMTKNNGRSFRLRAGPFGPRCTGKSVISQPVERPRVISKRDRCHRTDVAVQFVFTKQYVPRDRRARDAESAVLDHEGNPTEYRFQGNVAYRARELIGKELGMFVERRKVETCVYRKLHLG